MVVLSMFFLFVGVLHGMENQHIPSQVIKFFSIVAPGEDVLYDQEKEGWSVIFEVDRQVVDLTFCFNSPDFKDLWLDDYKDECQILDVMVNDKLTDFSCSLFSDELPITLSDAFPVTYCNTERLKDAWSYIKNYNRLVFLNFLTRYVSKDEIPAFDKILQAHKSFTGTSKKDRHMELKIKHDIYAMVLSIELLVINREYLDRLELLKKTFQNEPCPYPGEYSKFDRLLKRSLRFAHTIAGTVVGKKVTYGSSEVDTEYTSDHSSTQETEDVFEDGTKIFQTASVVDDELKLEDEQKLVRQGVLTAFNEIRLLKVILFSYLCSGGLSFLMHKWNIAQVDNTYFLLLSLQAYASLILYLGLAIKKW